MDAEESHKLNTLLPGLCKDLNIEYSGIPDLFTVNGDTWPQKAVIQHLRIAAKQAGWLIGIRPRADEVVSEINCCLIWIRLNRRRQSDKERLAAQLRTAEDRLLDLTEGFYTTDELQSRLFSDTTSINVYRFMEVHIGQLPGTQRFVERSNDGKSRGWRIFDAWPTIDEVIQRCFGGNKRVFMRWLSDEVKAVKQEAEG